MHLLRDFPVEAMSCSSIGAFAAHGAGVDSILAMGATDRIEAVGAVATSSVSSAGKSDASRRRALATGWEKEILLCFWTAGAGVLA